MTRQAEEPKRGALAGEEIGRLLLEGGWRSERIAPDTWRSHFRGRNVSLPVFVRLDRSGYLSFAILPFVRSPKEAPRQEALFRRLLELNHRLMLGKFAIDDDLDVVLSVEYPTADLDSSEFYDALDVLSYYAEQYGPELLRLAEGGEPDGGPNDDDAVDTR